MLVLSRRKSEQIVIDGEIIVTVVEVRGDKVRIGIQAPKEVSVHRMEVQRDIDKGVPHEKKLTFSDILEQRRPADFQSSGYEPVRGDVPADASVSSKPSQQNLSKPEAD